SLLITKLPAVDPRVFLVTAVRSKRLVRPEALGRRAVGQFEQERGPDVVGSVRRTQRSAEYEALFIFLEVTLVRMQVLGEEGRRVGTLGSGAKELLHPFGPVIGRPPEKAVRPAADIRSFVDARSSQRVGRDQSFGGGPVLELDEPRSRQRCGCVVRDNVAVADHALAERSRLGLLGGLSGPGDS